MAVTAVATKSATFDEPTHFAAGYSYWLRNDYRLDPEAGVLPLRFAALPLLASPPHFVAPNAPPWQQRAQGKVGSTFLYDLGNNADTLLLKGRMMMALLSAALCALIYCWSRSLFGAPGGLISLSIAAFCPTLLGHGALVTADVTAALFFALASWTLWRIFEGPSATNVVAAGACVAGLLLSKMSGAIVVLLILGLAVARLCFRRTVASQSAGEHNRSSSRQIVRGAIALCCVAAISVLLIWTAYGFRYAAAADGAESIFAPQWRILLARDGLMPTVMSFARRWHLLPEAYLYGFAYAQFNAQARPSFLDGNWSMTGFLDFFPRAFFYKTPPGLVALLLMAALAAIFVARGTLRDHGFDRAKLISSLYHATPAWMLLLVYGGFALSARLNIGHRHILPVYVACYVLAGASAIYLRRSMTRLGAAVVIFLVASVVTESVVTRPDYLAYFSPLAGGANRGYTHLVDSSVDWGQDLSALQEWLGTNDTNHQPVYLAYFGTAKPEYYGIRAIQLPLSPDLPLQGLRGGRYCVSATTLQQVYSHAMGNWAAPYETLYQQLRTELETSEAQSDPRTRRHAQSFRELEFARLCATLRHRQPSAMIGHSILIYDLADDDVRRALCDPPAELSPGIAVAGIN